MRVARICWECFRKHFPKDKVRVICGGSACEECKREITTKEYRIKVNWPDPEDIPTEPIDTKELHAMLHEDAKGAIDAINEANANHTITVTPKAETEGKHRWRKKPADNPRS